MKVQKFLLTFSYLFLFSLLIVIGCSTPSVIKEPGTLPPIVKEYKDIKLYPYQPGMKDTGIEINGHAYITLFARGEINIWPGGPEKYQHLKPNDWVLMMRVGEKGYRKHPISKGNNSNTFLVSGKGNLYFGIWCCKEIDDHGNPLSPEKCMDDTGSFDLAIIVWNQFPDEKAIKYLQEFDNLNPGQFAVKEKIISLRENKDLVNIKDLIIPPDLKIKNSERFYQSAFDTQVEHDIIISQEDIIAIIVQGKIIGTYKDLRPFKIFPTFQTGKSSIEYSTSFDDVLIFSSSKDSKLYSVIYGRLWEGGGWEKHYILGCLTANVLVWDKAHAHSIQSDLLKLIRNNPGNKKLPLLFSYMGDYFRRTGDIVKALDFEKAFSQIEKNIGTTLTTGTILNHRGKLQEHLGNFDEAIKHFQNSIKSSEDEKNERIKAISLIDLGRIYYKLESTKKAMECFEHAWDLVSEEAPGYEWPKLVRDKFKKDPVKKVYFFKEKPKFRGLKKIAEFWMGNVYKKMKDFNRASYMFAGLSDFKGFPVQDAEAIYYLSLADLHLQKGDPDQAIQSFEKALQVARSTESVQMIWRSLAGLGIVHEQKENLAEAFKQYADAIKIIENMRAMLESEEQKASFINDKMYVYERIIGVLQRMMRDDDAFYYLESSKARAFLDMLGNKRLSAKKKEELGLLDKERRLKEEIRLLSGAQRSEKEMSSEEIEKSRERLKEIRAQYQSVLNNLKKIRPELASMVTVSPFRAKDIQNLLDEQTALVEYYVGEENCYVFIVSKDKVLCKSLDFDPGKLNEIFELRQKMVEGISLQKLKDESYKTHLRNLYAWLISPIEEQIQNKTSLIIVPHGILHYLPFHALLNKKGMKESYLVEHFRISYAPSASVLKFAIEKNRNNRKSLFAAANPKTSLSELPASELEARNVASLFTEKKVIIGELAKESEVKINSPNFDYILFSTHGEMVEKAPLMSNLRFVSGQGEDGRLTVDELFDMKVKANLVTLSSCETGLVKGRKGDLPRGDDLIGLTRAFIYAGSPSVVASLWKVADESTVELVTSFYKNLRVMNKADALKNAQLALMNGRVTFNLKRNRGGITNADDYKPGSSISCSHPFFWAPFILVGDWR